MPQGAADMHAEGKDSYDQGHRFKDRSLSIAGGGPQFIRNWTYSYDPAQKPAHAPASVAFSIGQDSARDALLGYDDIGRLTRIGPNGTGAESTVGLLSNRAMTWDAAGRLLKVRGVKDAALPGNEDALREEYVYDFGGNRTLKIDHPGPDKLDAKPEDDIAEAATVYMTPFYARPYGGIGAVEISQGSLPVATLTPPMDPSERPVVSYLFSDLPTGSMTASVTEFGEPAAEGAGATVVGRREYSPFGLELTTDDYAGTGQDGAALLSVFHGKELDRITSFSSFGARSYSRDLGTWLSPDPEISNYLGGNPNGGVYAPANLSRFAYAHNRPTFANDPDGRWVKIAASAAAGAVIFGGADVIYQLHRGGKFSYGQLTAVAGVGAAVGGVGAYGVLARVASGGLASVAANAPVAATVATAVGGVAQKVEEVAAPVIEKAAEAIPDVMPRALTATDLGIEEGALQELEGTYSVSNRIATVQIDKFKV